jgi:hypothetical protein
MKNFSLALLCVATSLILGAQNNVSLNIEHVLGDASFAFGQDADQGDYIFDVNRLQYYISDISITHDGGNNTTITDTWLLVDASENTPFDLGNHDITTVEAITFYVGVGPDVNHDDPSLWQSSHPLAPKNPSMHWGWASGYKFITLEGNAGPTVAENEFQIHALGDDNYFETSVEVSATAEAGNLTIPLKADYVNSLMNIDVSGGIINHSLSGISITLLENFSTDVFTSGVVNSIDELDFSNSISISPNPSVLGAELMLDLPDAQRYIITVIDIQGKRVFDTAVQLGEQSVNLPDLPAGAYVVNLLTNEQIMTSARWIVE